MEMPRPGEEHEKLARFEGIWTGEEIMHPSPWLPGGGTAQARNENRIAVDGFILVRDYEQRREGVVTFRGHGVHSFDAHRGCHVLHWFDSMGMPPNVFTGNFEGVSLIMASSSSMPGTMQTRSAYDLSDPDTMRLRMETSSDGESWSVFMEGTYTRE